MVSTPRFLVKPWVFGYHLGPFPEASEQTEQAVEKLPVDTKIKSLACSEAELLHEELHRLLSNFDVDFDDLADVFVLPWHVF